MDLNQRKLTKVEWNNIELPVSADEKDILNLIISGYTDVNIRYNKNTSLIEHLKIDGSEIMEDYLYNKYFSEKIKKCKQLFCRYSAELDVNVNPGITIKKADMIRLEKNSIEKINKSKCFEYVLLDLCEELLLFHKNNNNQWMNKYFTLYKSIKMNIGNVNRHVLSIVDRLLTRMEEDINMTNVIGNSVELIEKNELLLKYSDMVLYDHQKELMTIVKHPGSKLILYIAPTGTGKTLSPIGLSENKRVIFLCAARHVGLALAKSAISVGKKVAFAFGCESAVDIRLHYFAAKEYKTNKKSGGIGKVDNSIGDKVEIMICDIKSYLTAMYYMQAFNSVEDIITYWDEPTITMDYEMHVLHDIIQKNWRENIIPTLILSSATLPKLHELNETVASFKLKFKDATIYNIVSHDCKKSIPIVNKYGYVILPHTITRDYNQVKIVVEHCNNNLSLLRYFDLNEVVEFIVYIQNNTMCSTKTHINRHFMNMGDVTMQNIKLHYLRILSTISLEHWNEIYCHFNTNGVRKVEINNTVQPNGTIIKKVSSIVGTQLNLDSVNSKSVGHSITRTSSQQTSAFSPEQAGIYVTTKDAFTLTDGPTIFLANDVEKIAKFCIQQANIPSSVMENILEKIEFNNSLNSKIDEMEQLLEDLTQDLPVKDDSDEGKHSSIFAASSQSKLKDEIDRLKSLIKSAQLNEAFVPNKQLHLKKWTEGLKLNHNVYTSDVDEHSIIDIMMLKDVEDSWKVLLLMGIGVFTNHPSIAYTEIVKKLAEQQKLYMIIASSDYIYGTNYQFCHGYLSKDMSLTQEKIIQAMGRIGRTNMHHQYSIRFRDDEQILKLFYPEHDKIEVSNMNRLFSE